MNPGGQDPVCCFASTVGQFCLVVDSLDLECSSGGFRRLLPNSMQVGHQSGGGTSTNNIKHELSPIMTVTMH